MQALWFRGAVALALAFSLAGFPAQGQTQPLVTQGIGLSSCAKLGPDLKPGSGLDHLPNALLFYWVQGYMSAANIYLLNEYTDYVDLSGVDDATIVKMVADFCSANPDKKPISALRGTPAGSCLSVCGKIG